MKMMKKLLQVGLVAAMAFVGLGAHNVEASQAQTATQTDRYNQQVSQLKLAVDDMVNVVNTNAYFNYASQTSKANYEQAIGNANVLLARVPNTTYEELRDATIRINNAKNAIEAEVRREVSRRGLQQAVDQAKLTVKSAYQLMEIMPNFAQKNGGKLQKLINEQQALITEAEAVLRTM